MAYGGREQAAMEVGGWADWVPQLSGINNQGWALLLIYWGKGMRKFEDHWNILQIDVHKLLE